MRTLLLVVGLGLAVVPEAAYAQAPSDSTYTVESGDTLYSIAQRYGVSVAALQRWNDLDGTALRVGQTLRVRPPAAPPPPDTTTAPDTTAPPDTTTAPSPTGADTAVTMDRDTAATAPRPYGTYTTEAGDTVVSLALRTGTTVDSLLALNEGLPDSLAPGQTLRLPRRFGPPTHRVRSGETLYSIAGRYGASVRALRSLNDLDTTALQPGQRLRLPGRAASVNPPGTWATPDTTGAVARYPDAFAGRLMASGRAYDPDDYAVSHPSLPLGSVVLLSHPDTDRHTFAHVLDRGPVAEDVLLDVSAAVAERLGLGPEAGSVALRVVWRAE